MLYELKNLRKASGFTQASMAEKLGVPLGTYRNWEQGIYAPQDISLIKQIADILHVSMEALFGYDAFEPGALDEGLSDEEQFVYVPLYGRIAAGQPLYMDAVEDHILAPREIRRRHPNAFFLTVDGDSMNNVLPNGCYALASRSGEEVSRCGWHGVRGLCERLRRDHQAHQTTRKRRGAYPRL